MREDTASETRISLAKSRPCWDTRREMKDWVVGEEVRACGWLAREAIRSSKAKGDIDITTTLGIQKLEEEEEQNK